MTGLMQLSRSARHKFTDPRVTAKGEPRATVSLVSLETLWFNTGTRCNIECAHCYIESSPQNDRLSYLTAAEATRYLDEIRDSELETIRIGITGGEPFLNPECPAIIRAALVRGFEVLVLTNAMKPMMRPRVQSALVAVNEELGASLVLRVSLDHYRRSEHDRERGDGSFDATLVGLRWLAENGFRTHLAGRTRWGEDEEAMRDGYARLVAEVGVPVDCYDDEQLVLFPEMSANDDPPEITEGCWDILDKRPHDLMCARSRMVVKRRSSGETRVIACTLLPYTQGFDLGATLTQASGPVALNHPFCSSFCVLGGGSCSS